MLRRRIYRIFLQMGSLYHVATTHRILGFTAKISRGFVKNHLKITSETRVAKNHCYKDIVKPRGRHAYC
jgi:urease beta subunit